MRYCNSKPYSASRSKIKKLLQLLHGIIRTLYGVTNRPKVSVDLVIIASDKALVTEEVNVLVLGARDVLLSLDVLQAVSLVPAGRENVKRDLTTDRKAVFQ